MTKAHSPVHALLEIPFRVESIVQAAAPDGSDGIWHRYVISQGTNSITGLRAGTHAEVASLLDEMVDRLNERCGKQLAKLKK
jgi:hypothetical protein